MIQLLESGEVDEPGASTLLHGWNAVICLKRRGIRCSTSAPVQ